MKEAREERRAEFCFPFRFIFPFQGCGFHLLLFPASQARLSRQAGFSDRDSFTYSMT